MTEIQGGAAGTGGDGGAVHVAVADIGAVYTGLPLDPLVQAASARRYGWLYFAEHMVRQLRAYIVSVLFYDLGQIFLYLVAMGLALGSLVDANTESVDGVSYLMFVAPALVVLLACAALTASATAACSAVGSAIRLVKRARSLPSASRVARPMICTTSVRLLR